MTICAGAIIRQSNRNVNTNIKMSISSKKKEKYHGDHKSIVTIYNSCNWDKKLRHSDMLVGTDFQQFFESGGDISRTYNKWKVIPVI